MAFKYPEMSDTEKKEHEIRQFEKAMKDILEKLERKESDVSRMAEKFYLQWCDTENGISEVESKCLAQKAFTFAENFVNIEYDRKEKIKEL